MIERKQQMQNQDYSCSTQRQHFNYLRNNSCGIWGAFTWGNQQDDIQSYNNRQQSNSNQSPNKQFNDQYQQGRQSVGKQAKKVTFDEGNTSFNQKNPQRAQSAKKTVMSQHKPRNNGNFQRKSRIVKDEEAQKQKNEQNKRKVQNYIEQMKPYSRTLTNSKFQQYYGKAAPQCYGRANINEPIGGIIYGNHLKTFNMNPHTYQNNPQNYQTHTTALNYGKRTKICPEEKWKKLERELSKKLGLKEKNQTIKQGKEVVYVDIDDSNMYQTMKQNHEFAKANREEIHARQVQYKKQKQQEHIDNINQFHAKKQDRIANGIMNQSTIPSSSQMDPDQYQAKLNQQVIYKYHDKNGNIRYAADRHAVTCFVDLNFPENDAIYTEQLKNRMPIFPKRVEGEDKNIDAIRVANCKKGKQEIYPSHYLIRNCEEPEVVKMLSEKTGTQITGKRLSQGSNPRAQQQQKKSQTMKNNSFMSTNYSKNNPQENQQSFDQIDQNAVQSQIMDRAWQNPRLANSVNQQNGRNSTCCQVEHLPHNEMNPQCYKNASGIVSRIPFAG